MSDLFYEEIEPESSLTDFVKRFWTFSNATEETKHYTILPDGYFDIIIKPTGIGLVSTSLFGLWTKEIEVIVPPRTTIIGICCKPLAADYMLRHSIASILNAYVELPNDFLSLDTTAHYDFKTFTAKITEEMLSLLKSGNVIDSRKQAIFNILFTSHGGLAVQELSDKAGWSNRQINRYFRRQFGLPLKAYANVLRCAAAYTHIREGDLFSEDDFYDQAHFIKEIKRYTGFKPKELHKNENDRFLQFYTLPKKQLCIKNKK